MSNTIKMVKKDVPFGLCAMEASGGFSKSSFGLVVGEYRLRLADEEVQADCFGNTLKKFGYGDKWNRVKASKGNDVKGGF